MHVVVPILAVVPGIAWLSCLIHAVLLVQHRRAGVTRLQLLMRGHLFFDRTTFAPEAAPLHRRFLVSVVVFAVGVVALMSAAAAGW